MQNNLNCFDANFKVIKIVFPFSIFWSNNKFINLLFSIPHFYSCIQAPVKFVGTVPSLLCIRDKTAIRVDVGDVVYVELWKIQDENNDRFGFFTIY